MSPKLSRVLGRIDIRVPGVLALLFLLVLCGFSAAKLATAFDDSRSVETWDDVVGRFLDFREQSHMLVVPSWYMVEDQVESVEEKYGLAGFQNQPDWYWTFDAPPLSFSSKSPIAQFVKHGTELFIYEDMTKGEVLVMSVSGKGGGEYKEEVVYTSPDWPAQKKGERSASYLARELSKRRIAWRVTLQDEAVVEALDSEPAEDEGSGGVMMLMMSGGSCTEIVFTAIEPQESNAVIDVGLCVPDGIANVDLFATTNLLPEGFPWFMAGTNLPVTTNSVVWSWANVDETNVFLAAGNSSQDSDGDGLQDAREFYLYGTDKALPDTDGDGLGDKWEIDHGLSPTDHAGANGASGDPDGDGLSNLGELQAGTNPQDPDSDDDFSMDGYETTLGYNPLLRTNFPPRSTSVNGDGGITLTTNRMLQFNFGTGTHAHVVKFADNRLMTNAVTNAFSQILSNELFSATSGYYVVYARLVATNALQSDLIHFGVLYDITTPVLSMISPQPNEVTNRGKIDILGSAVDVFDDLRIFVNSNYVDGFVDGQFVYSGLPLQCGSNSVLVEAQDRVGHSASTQFWVMVQCDGDTSPPVASFVLPQDYQIVAGVTSYFNTTTFGDTEELYVRGLVAADATKVWLSAVSEGGDSTEAESVGLMGTQWLGRVSLFPGSNRLELVASDVAGNTSTNVAMVYRDTGLVFRILSPAAFAELATNRVMVSGEASAALTNAGATINGVAVSFGAASNGLCSFQTVSPVLLSTGLNYFLGEGQVTGRSIYADPPSASYPGSGYSQTMWRQGSHSILRAKLLGSNYVFSDERKDDSWTAPNTYYTDVFTTRSTVSLLLTNYEYSLGVTTFTSGVKSITMSPPPGLAWMINMGYDSADFNYGGIVSVEHRRFFNSERGFIKHAASDEEQWVLLKFNPLWVGQTAFYSTSIAHQVRFRGSPAIVLAGGARGFVTKIRPNVEHRVSASDFEWPTHTKAQGYSVEGHVLTVGAVSNSDFRVSQITATSPAASNSPQEFEGHKMDFGDPCSDGLFVGKSLIVFFDDVHGGYDANNNELVADFEITMHADGIPLPHSSLTESWAQTSGPQSGTLDHTNTYSVAFQNPKQGGIYRFEFDLGVPGVSKSAATVTLPLAGAESADFVREEFARISNWVDNEMIDIPIVDRLYGLVLLRRALIVSSNLDYSPGHWTGTNSPCKRYSLPVAETLTVEGVVMSSPKLANMMWGVLCRRFLYWDWFADLGADFRNRIDHGILSGDTVAATSSYELGRELSEEGIDELRVKMREYREAIREPNGIEQRLFPSVDLLSAPPRVPALP